MASRYELKYLVPQELAVRIRAFARLHLDPMPSPMVRPTSPTRSTASALTPLAPAGVVRNIVF